MKKLSELYKTILANHYWSAVLIAIVCLSVHGVTVLNDYNLDDNLVTQNHRLTSKGISAIPEIYSSPYYQDDMGYSYGYRPTTLASFAIEKSLFGESAAVSHSVNLILYLITCLLMFFLIVKIFPNQITLALGAALLFTVHPIHTEVVASIKNRDEILALLFALSGCFVLINPKRWWINVLIGSAFFFLSVSSKMSAVNVILLLAIIPAYQKPLAKDLVLITLYSLAIYFVLDGRDTIYTNSIRNVLVLTTLYCAVRIAASLKTNVKKIYLLLAKSVKTGKYIWSRFAKKLPTTYSYTTFEKIQITVGSIATYALLIESLNDIQQIIFFIVVIGSFIFVRTNKPDIFLRLSILPLAFGNYSEWTVLVYLSFGVATLQKSLQNFALKSLVVITIGSALSFYWELLILSEENLMMLGVLLFLSYSKSVRLKWVLIGLSFFLVAVLTIGLLMLNLQFEDTVQIVLLYAAIVISSFFVRFDSEKVKSINLFKSLGYNTTTITKIVFPTVFLFFCISIINPYFTTVVHSKLITTSGSKIKDRLLDFRLETLTWFYGNQSKEVYGKPWTANHAQSSNRPFDFVEHPLDPFAPANAKYGTAVITLNRYLGKLFFPYPLAFYYGFNEVKIGNLLSLQALFAIVIHLLLVLVMLSYWRTNTALSIGIFAYLSSIILFSGTVEIVAGMFADRFSYTASFGFCIAIVAVFKMLQDKLKGSIHVLSTVCALVLISSFSAYSFHRNTLWKNKLTLMRHDIKSVPNSAQAHNLLAHGLMETVFADGELSETEKSREVREAALHFKRATEIYPQFFNAWVDLGRVNMQINQSEKAIFAFEKALSEDSTYTPLLLDLASLNNQLGNKEGASVYYRKYIETGVSSPEVYDALARILYELGRYQESINICQQYLRIEPANTEFKRNILMMQGKLNENSQNKPELGD